MRFLVDRCAGRRLARWLAAQGHDVVEPSGSAPDPSDEELLRRAHGEQRILVTIDSDFGRLIHLQGLPFCGLIRLPDVPADVRLALMRQILETYDEAELQSLIVTVRGRRIRISRAPEHARRRQAKP